MELNLNLPSIDSPEFFRTEVEQVLLSIRNQIESTYNERIRVAIVPATNINGTGLSVLSYAVYLSFVGKNGFSYRLIELICKNPDGGLPVIVNAFNGPTASFGEANTIQQLNKIIEEIFANQRTRTLILSNY